MYASRLQLKTLRESPADAEVLSHQMLTRAGYLHKLSSGVYIYGPLLKRVLDKVQAIIAEEISRTGALEIIMPTLQDQQLWERSGRWATYQASGTLLTTTDRNGQIFGLAPTAEEVVTDYVNQQVNSYKQLPVCYFQQTTKFRDEIRPRFGLLRVKEFIMMDAYSFHTDDASLDDTYQAMKQAYHRIFERLGLQALAVEADTGEIGGSGSHEFMVTASIGEDTILFEADGSYAANLEKAVGVIPALPAMELPTEDIHTPACTTVKQLVSYLQQHLNPQLEAGHILKSLLYLVTTAEQTYQVGAFIRGDRELNEAKLRQALYQHLGQTILGLEAMPENLIRQQLGSAPGYIGPQGLKLDLALLDTQVDPSAPMIIGANRIDYHTSGFVCQAHPELNFKSADLLRIQAGDLSSHGLPLSEQKGIEVGHIFKLGTKYSAAMQATYQDQAQQKQPFVMGCYGIGSSRIVAAALEQHATEQAIVWPLSMAPYHVVIMAIGKDNLPQLQQGAQQLYQQLQAQGVEAIYDDRDLGPGVKFKDWELVGIPLRIVFGKQYAQGLVEMKFLNQPLEVVPLAEVAERIQAWLTT